MAKTKGQQHRHVPRPRDRPQNKASAAEKLRRRTLGKKEKHEFRQKKQDLVKQTIAKQRVTSDRGVSLFVARALGFTVAIALAVLVWYCLFDERLQPEYRHVDKYIKN